VLSKFLPSMDAVRAATLARHRLRLILVSCGVVLLAAGCSAKPRFEGDGNVPGTATSNEDLNRQLAVMASQNSETGDYIIGSEDLVEITLFDLADGQGEPRVITARVSNTGVVTLPYIGNIDAAGLTPAAFENNLRTAYSTYIHNPQLTVFVREYRSYRVSVMGYVTTPGVLELRGKKTLIEAIAMAGGLTDEASKNIRVSRATEAGLQTVLVDLDRIAEGVDVGLNLAMLPGDVVTVPKAGTFYVEGVVRKPGAYPLLEHTTVSQAIATAGGADVTIAKMSGTTLFRKDLNGERVAIPVDLAALKSGRTEDVPIQADDVIVVPMSGPRFWFDRFTSGVFRVGLSAPIF
jgi:polysaccharide export outer membrane protein